MNEPIAIVGLGCRFPGGADSPEAFWRLLLDGVDAIRPLTRDGLDRFYDPRPATPGRMYTRWAGLLAGLDRFDADFFGISPREAASLDPAQRLLLETTWEALEDATIDPNALRGESVGVYVGQWLSDFENRLFADPEQVDLYATTGSGRYASSGRLSYFLGLTGPSITLDTACSSSLVAIHLACQSLRAGESSLAIAAGVNVILQPHIWIAYSQSGMMAEDGHCKFGDARGDGYVRSEGVGVVLLKPLSRAEADGDRIQAIIRGSAVNNDGRGSGHLATPSRAGQAAMLRKAYADADVEPARVGYVEAHGTGTRTGDPIELAALGDVLAPGRALDSRCWIGSVKTNIGHTEGAAGMAGVLKCVLALQHRELPASLHFQEPNPAVPWAELPFDVPCARTAWPTGDQPRLAGVSGFGITGTNAHVVLQEGPTPRPATTRELEVLPLVLSAVTASALQAMATAYADDIDADPARSLHDLCATAACHRTAFQQRAVFVASDRATLIDKLRRFASGDASAVDATNHAGAGTARRIAFVFSGQGGQWLGMARELLAREPLFRTVIERCDAAMPAARGWSALEQLELEAEDARYRLREISVLQPTLLAVEIALAELWRARGIEPEAVIGHSLGEAGAAYLAGALSLSDAMRVICARSALMQRTSGSGAMALVGLNNEQTLQRIASRASAMSVAASNGPRTSVVSGDPSAVAALLAELEKEGVFCRAVQVDVASHSPQMQPLVPELVDALAELRNLTPSIALYSTVRARRLESGECNAEYWGHNLRQPVQFMKTIERMLADGIDTFIEVGPHPTLLASIAEIGVANPPLTLSSLRRAEPERAALLASLGGLWAAGHPLSWATIFPLGSYTRAPLPHYPWQRERHWSSAALPLSVDGTTQHRAPLDANVQDWLYTESWQAAPIDSVAPGPNHWLLIAPEATDSADRLGAALRESGAAAEIVSSLDDAALWLHRNSKQPGLGIVIFVAPADPRPAWTAVAAVQRLQSAGQHADPAPRLWWVTAQAQPIPGDAEPLSAPAQTSLWGAARVIAAEHPNWWGGLVDVSAHNSLTQSKTLAQHLRSGSTEDQVAIRGSARYVLRLLKAELGAASAAPPQRLRSDAAYLMTGGMGGIGLEIAKALVAEGARRIVLLGRSALPERSAWSIEPETSAAGRRIAAIRAIEHAGAAVHVVQADVGDKAQLAAGLKAYANQGFPAIRGVIHCAAVIENKLTRDMTEADFERALAPKLSGALALDELLPTLDLFVLFSSMSAFWGPPGMSNYAAANAGLDALARARRARGEHALSIQWGHWTNIGLSEGAIAIRNGEELERVGVGSLSVAQGTSLFAWLLAQAEPVIATLPIDWAKFRQARRGRDWPLFRVAAGSADDDQARTSLAERLQTASPLERRSLLESVIREALGAVLRRPGKEFDARRSFGSAGLDSLMALEFRNRLETATERSLPATLAWNYPTIEQLVRHLDAQLTRAPALEAATDTAATSLSESTDIAALFGDIAALSDADAARALRGSG
ncbi:MAG: type I polyketide synthase [Polyangiaceae bacterium]